MSRHKGQEKLAPYVLSLRRFRIFHRWTGIILALLLTISAITGILLALKKDVAMIQPPTQRGQSKTLEDWKPLDQLALLSKAALTTAHPDQQNNSIDRLDVRPAKGIVKVLFDKGFWEVQIDGQSGTVLSIDRRHCDWIESLHDGSIISDLFKLISMNFLGWGLLFLLSTGLWLWYGPRLLRSWRQRRGLTQ